MFEAITPGEDAVGNYLNALPMAWESPWASLECIHFVRLHVLLEFVHQGQSQHLNPFQKQYLVADARFDGSLPELVLGGEDLLRLA